MTLNLLLMSIFPACMALAAGLDLVSMTIPNRLVAVLAASFFVVAPYAGLGVTDIGLHAGLAFAMLTLTFGMFAMGWIGGGDAKLFAATALWLGPQATLDYALIAGICGGALTLALLSFRMMPLPAGLAGQTWLARLHEPREGVPYGIALAAAGLGTFAETPIMRALAG